MNKIIFVTGASGTGKTTAVEALKTRMSSDFIFHCFDSIGVPSESEMKEKYGGPEAWQKMETFNWVERIKRDDLNKGPVVFDGQVRQSFIEDACKANDVKNYQIIVFVCDDEERDKRLVARGQPELANKDMSNWNAFLKREAESRGDLIIDTTNFVVGQAEKEVEKILRAK